MKKQIENLVYLALKKMQEAGEISAAPAFIQLDNTKDKNHGDLASNVALILAKLEKQNPRKIAERIVASLPESADIAKVEVAGPGFINFFVSDRAIQNIIPTILKEKECFGTSKSGREKKVLLEFVSANPNGPLHVGHGRHAAFGAVVSNLLQAVGFKTYKEYYVNDAGRQMDILTVSVWLRYLGLCGETIVFPANAYKGEYVIDIARDIKDQHAEKFQIPAQQVFEELPLDEPKGGDKEIYIDAMIVRCKKLLGYQYKVIFDIALEKIVHDISDDLAEFGVHFDNWFSERDFVATDVMNRLLQKLRDNNSAYEEKGALWFRSTQFGDDKDRVLVRSNGARTYFANDVAYHLHKFERGFDIALTIMGSDHHGYLARMKAAMAACDINPERLVHLLGQFVTLYRAGEQVQMSTRGGTFVTLRELRSEVGNDVARFFYIMRRYDQHIDFDLDLAKSQSNENPVYYVQYAYARINSVFKQFAERNREYDEQQGLANIHLLTAPQERQLLNTLAQYPEILMNAALQYEPHLMTHYLRDVAADFHAYYNSHQFLVDDMNLCNARLALISATKQVLLNAFNIIGISAPTSM